MTKKDDRYSNDICEECGVTYGESVVMSLYVCRKCAKKLKKMEKKVLKEDKQIKEHGIR